MSALVLAQSPSGPPSFDSAAAAFVPFRETNSSVNHALAFAQGLREAQLPLAALLVDAQSVADSDDVRVLSESLQGQVTLDDEVIIPTVVASFYDARAERWRQLPSAMKARVNELMGRSALRAGRDEEAIEFLDAVTPPTPQSRYALAVALGARDAPRAKQLLESLTRERGDLKEMATMALARLAYAGHDYQEAQRQYRAIPSSSTLWPRAQVEFAYARFMAEDSGGALGKLTSLNAPQLSRAFEPEAHILAATIYYFGCMYAQARAELDIFERTYRKPPELEATAPIGQGTKSSALAIWLVSDTRSARLRALLNRADTELRMIADDTRFRGSDFARFVQGVLEKARESLKKVSAEQYRARVQEATDTLNELRRQADVLRFEIARAEGALLEGSAPLQSADALPRPSLAGESWEYWPFDGEYWHDEIGKYEVSFASRCPLQ